MAMMIRMTLAVALLAATAEGALAAGKDQSRILPDVEVAQTTAPQGGTTGTSGTDGSQQGGTSAAGQSGTSGTTGTGATSGTDQSGAGGASGSDQNGTSGNDNVTPDLSQPDQSDDNMSLGEIPDITTIELTPDMAKKALDVYTLVKTKYANTDLEQYDNLQDFVDQNAKGKEFEADIKAAGFANVNDWNTAITTLGFAYTGVTNDPTADINQQISEIETDTKIAKDMKDRMIKSLRAMIPSENNKKIVQDLMKDPGYNDKLQQLDTQEE